MELPISAVTSELVSRFVSFLLNKYQSHRHTRLEQQNLVEKLQHLLIRARTVVEEADRRCIANSGMLMQLKMLSEAMYRGHHVLDVFNFQQLLDSSIIDEVSDSSYLSFPFKRPRRIASKAKGRTMQLELHGALKSLGIVVANMAEFVVLLGGCERMSRRPYDAYLYTDHFMFGRHVEKQKLLGFLLQENPVSDEPVVLPIIGAVAVGKKTLVAHVCNNERVRSHFTSILHLNGDSLLRIIEHDRTMLGSRFLVVVDFVSHVDDKDWTKFYSFLRRMGKGSKVIIINPSEHPQLVRVAEEFAKIFHPGGSLMAANAFADVLRRNFDVEFWLCLLGKTRGVIQKNLSEHGVDPYQRFEQGHTVDITDFTLHPSTAIRIANCTNGSNRLTNGAPMKMETVTLGELLVNPNNRSKGEFILLSWESRIPPYTRFEHIVASSVQDLTEGVNLPGSKKRQVPI
ncbi:disease resistance protein RGA2-like isoform X2 [Hordeum vulgare subsp. vulgare]|uniref:disease resistance protein RGA2-like isoform X2 n=1 Tax=Hordeum vulgare subsp. vulgare TaxID=112509 RepID=UPI001D1A464E|nr:disease resistance protein RGA2-like isoform X2 [Hordeum vulgare subsp. vulgare]